MVNHKLNQSISMNLSYFACESLYSSMKVFFDQMHIPVNYLTESSAKPSTILTGTYKSLHEAHQLMQNVYFLGMIDDSAFKHPHQVTDLQIIRDDYEGMLVFGVELNDRPNRLAPSRSQIAEICRCFNREYHYMPVVLILKYFIPGAGLHISFASCERLPYKQHWREGHKTGRVSILKDICVENPHSGHLRILLDMFIERAGKYAVNSYAELNQRWQEVFNISLLNKQFYKEIFDWYLWACQIIKFLNPEANSGNEKIHTSISVIRLLTRLIFCWFIKEKHLLHDILFNPIELQHILKSFDLSSDSDSGYYLAILQNLFFATFNTDMPKDAPGSRKFIDPKQIYQGYHESHLDHLLYRHKERFLDPDKALDLFQDIPFLNGGLFECLDSRDPITNLEKRYDGFSSKSSKQPIVPNFLFFADKVSVDLSDDFDGDKRKKNVTVRGLINILNDYKFTISENTPLEQEIALDPELLGKVFENLLASYNPETKMTARKQTGSFYTPREIVNYMVDESLIAYLKIRLEDLFPENQKQEIEAQLRILFDPSCEENPFAGDEKMIDLIIEHLSNCRILDPACGSGAFPMGILHKMVNVLGKLDANNIKWKQAQMRKAKHDMEAARKMQDEEIRARATESAEIRIQYIKESFDNPHHELDYARKLFLIENCIFGIDIQNIAVQISKLRFFISLMVDQRVNPHARNKGILSLPNLETKFVAANTLAGLDKGAQESIQTYEVQKLEQELKDIRHRIFFTRKYSEKKKLKMHESEKRKQLQTALLHGGYPIGSSAQVAGWDPFDPVHSASFFDVETMFGFTGGFDIIIGNPPYVRQEKIKDALKRSNYDLSDKKEEDVKSGLKESYECYTGVSDLYVYFYEKGFKLLHQSGVLAYISSNKYFRSGYGEKLRAFFSSKATIAQLIDFGDAPVFESIAYPCIAVIINKKSDNSSKTKILSWQPGPDIADFDRIFSEQSFEIPQKELSRKGWILESQEMLRLLDKLRHAGIPLSEYVNEKLYRGILTGLNEAFVVDKQTRNRLITEHPSSEEFLKPFLRGEHVKRWKVEFDEQYLIKIESSKNKHHKWSGRSSNEAEKIFKKSYPAIYTHFNKFRDRLINRDDQGDYFWELRSCAYWNEFEQPKIIFPDIAQDSEFSYDNHGYYLANTLYLMPTKKIWLLGILNSKTIFWFYTKLSTQIRGGFVRFIKQYVSQIPINESLSESVTPLIKQIMTTKKDIFYDIIFPLEAQLDALVAYAYGLTENEYMLILNDLKLEDSIRSACLKEYNKIAK